jgi:hypothetical protein
MKRHLESCVTDTNWSGKELESKINEYGYSQGLGSKEIKIRMSKNG